ncbi:MAG: arsenic resistance protein [Candidatus Bathyarchaeia archaeon]
MICIAVSPSGLDILREDGTIDLNVWICFYVARLTLKKCQRVLTSQVQEVAGTPNLGLGRFEKYLTGWVFLCIIAGLLTGRFFPQLSVLLSELQVFHVSIPIAICLFFMIYSVMVQIDFKKGG